MQQTITVPIKRLDKTLDMPAYAYVGDAGLDLRAAEDAARALQPPALEKHLAGLQRPDYPFFKVIWYLPAVGAKVGDESLFQQHFPEIVEYLQKAVRRNPVP